MLEPILPAAEFPPTAVCVPLLRESSAEFDRAFGHIS
jgi:hypothetical protein